MSDKERRRAMVAVCIPTLDRPRSVQTLLKDLAAQTRRPDLVVVVDASDSDDTEEVCAEFGIGSGVLHHLPARRGLTHQRRAGIDHLRPHRPDYISMLDDDVVLSPTFLEEAVAFLESTEGQTFGGVCGYDSNNWGGPFTAVERLYNRIGLYDGELRAGRWLYCGRFLHLDRLERPEGIFRTDFLPGGLTVWRAEVFDRFLPPSALSGYGLGEDKHLSLRIASRYELGVLGQAEVWHEIEPSGVRFEGWRKGYANIRNHGQILRDCDASLRRYIAFECVNAIHLLVRTTMALWQRSWRDLPTLFGIALGLLVGLKPPSRTADALEVR